MSNTLCLLFYMTINYVLKDTDRKMTFIVPKKEKINIGDRFLCMTDGYAFKYDGPSNKY